MKRIAVLTLILFFGVMAYSAENQDDARRTFEQAYNKVFGPQGCTLHYDVNLVGVYKTNGTIWYKGKKNKFEDAKVIQWNDGTTAYALFKRKKTIEIYDVKSGKHDKYGSKFKFTLDDFDYTMERTDEGLWFTLKQRHDAKGTIKHVKALLNAQTLAPIHVKIKVALFWANIYISDFKSGGISDDVFVFPQDKFATGFKFVDKR